MPGSENNMSMNPMQFVVGPKGAARAIAMPPVHDSDEPGSDDYVWQRGQFYPIKWSDEQRERLPAKFAMYSRPSTAFPDRQKVGLVGPVDVTVDGERYTLTFLADEWRMETN